MHRVTDIKVRLDSASAETHWSLPLDWPAPAKMLWCDPVTRRAKLTNAMAVEQEWDDPLDALDWMAGTITDHPSPEARWIGYLSYDLGRLIEIIPNRAIDDLKLPLFLFTLHSPVESRPPVPAAPEPRRSDQPLRSNFTRPAYEAAVARAIDYIRAGDIFQVNLSQRFTAGLNVSPQFVYDRLNESSPAQYGACLNYGDFALISNSPELFLSVTPDGKVTTRPIKGTRPRADGMDKELRDSVKDQAELNMIVDLERNDFGRVCEIGTVKVTESRAIEEHPTVYHGVATIEGMLREDVTFADLLRATFPGGSITGAPKIRAMQIIEELEPVCRGPYCGAIGYLGADGSIQFNMAIRTMIVKDGLVHVPVGGGIVADSDPAAEYEETLVKAKAMFDALGVGPASR
jgi:anthranilate/para-aminobenzoate synthase component I